MICNNCLKLLNDKTAPFGICCCENNHYQCIKCDRENHKCCAACNSPTEIELPDFKLFEKKMQNSCVIRALTEIPVSTNTNDEVSNAFKLQEETFFTSLEIEDPILYSSNNENFDPEQIISSMFDIDTGEHLENNLNTKTSICSPSNSGSTVLSINLINLLEADNTSVETSYAGTIYSSMSTSPSTGETLKTQDSDSTDESDHTLTKNDNDDIVSIENYGRISTLSSPNSINRSSPNSEKRSSPQFNRFSPVDSEAEKKEENRSECSSVDMPLQKFFENFHESSSKPDWSKMDSRMPEILKSLKKSSCPAEELPWVWLQKVSKVLKHDSEQAEKRNRGKK